MANTRYLTEQVENHVRAALSEQYGVRFVKQSRPLRPGGHHEFDAVAEDGSIVASVKSASGLTSGGKHPSGKVTASIAELYFLTLVEAPRRLLVLTTPEFHTIFMRTMHGKVASGIEVVLIELPPEIQAAAAAVHRIASAEVTPVLDPAEQRASEEAT